MKKFLPLLTLVIGLIAGMVIVFAIKSDFSFQTPTEKESGSKFAGLEKNIVEIEKDIDFYKYFDSYSALLDEQEYDYLQEKLQSVEEEGEDSILIPIYLGFIFQDERIKNDFVNLKNKVSQATKEQNQDVFQKNTACGNLVSDLQTQIKNKYKTSSTEEEEFQFIFYSPNLNTCLYATKYTYSYTDLKDWEKSYSKKSMIVYNASTNIKIKDYIVYYSYNYPYLSKNEANKASEKDTKDFKKFILENSNYNIDLIKDQSYY